MSYEIFRELISYIGFDQVDAERLRAAGPVVRSRFPMVVERFYAEIHRHPGARAVIDDELQLERLKQTLHRWMEGLFGGEYGEAYYEDRARVGRMHVRVGLAQHYMFAAMDVLRQELESSFRECLPHNYEATESSLRKLLAIELAVMLESYKAANVEQVRLMERQEVQERLTQAEHLARIGRLAASLAHEIKNPLAGISGAIQVIRDNMRHEDAHRPVLNEVLRQIDRLDGTVKDLLIFARPTPPRFERCDLHRVIARMVGILSQEQECQRVRLVHAAIRPAPAAEIDEHQVEQVLMNLVLNAVHASRDGGIVTVSAGGDGEHVVIDVEDEGCGMDPETRRRATEAFFTTKAKGTGLGLSICARIIERHHGSLIIRSAVGKGTTVRIRLPLTQPIEKQGPTP
ncbi:MAG: hypothetical protein HZB38_02940 [Planctomycetes bacterium]|nr:hypothetical protein [Planctomycetota bacterium]